MFGVVLQLRAEAADVHLQVVGLVAVLVAPDARQQGFARHNMPGVADEVIEQPILSVAQGYGLLAALDLLAFKVDGQLPDPEGWRDADGRRQFRSAQDALDARQQLKRAERLGEIIVRTDLQTAHLV